MTAFNLKRPCPKCPFVQGNGYLRRERAREIATDIANGGVFACHQTTVYDEEVEDMVEGPKAQFCAGALIMMENQDAPNQAMRFAERLGLYDPSKLDMDAPVCRSSLEFISMHGDDDEAADGEPCSIAEMGCEAPAGFMIGGVAIDHDPGVEFETHECEDCGAFVCDNCAPYCYCKEDE